MSLRLAARSAPRSRDVTTDAESAARLRRLGGVGGERQAAERELHARLVRIAPRRGKDAAGADDRVGRPHLTRSYDVLCSPQRAELGVRV